MKSKLSSPGPRPKSPPIPIPSDLSAIVTKTAAIDIIGRLVRTEGEDDRSSKDKVRKRIASAIKDGALTPKANEAMRLADWLRWARTKTAWTEALAGLPPVGATGQAAAIGFMGLFGTPRVVPNELGECRFQLTQAWEQVRELEEANAVLKSKVAQLQASADRWEAQVARNRQSARKPRQR